jgi:hypothetical protein
MTGKEIKRLTKEMSQKTIDLIMMILLKEK